MNSEIVSRLDKLITLNERTKKFSQTIQSSWTSINEGGVNTAVYTDQLSNPIVLDSLDYEIAVISLETFYSFPNISEGVNNVFGYKTNPVNPTVQINIPTGSYSIEDIASEIKTQVGDTVYQNMTLTANQATLKAVFKLDPNFRIDFTLPNSIKDVLGFNAGIVGGVIGKKYYSGESIVNILDVNTVFVNCDLISGSYNNGRISPVIYSFFPDVAPGYKIVRNVENPVYLPVNKTQINNITTWLSDEKGRVLNFRGETISVRYHLRSKH